MSTRTSGLRIPYGMRDGRMWRPDQVATGLACECTCRSCDGVLEARNSGLVRRPYFAHRGATNCRAGFETAVHAMAKQVIVEAQQLMVPEWAGAPSMPAKLGLHDRWGTFHEGPRVHHPARMAVLTSVIAERAIGGIRPDVLAHDDDGALLIEVRVTHAVDARKHQIVRERRYRMVEIDLSKIHADDLFEMESFSACVLDEPLNRRWICWPEMEARWHASLAELSARAAAATPSDPPPVPPLPVDPPPLPRDALPVIFNVPHVHVADMPKAQRLHAIEVGSRIWQLRRGDGTVRARLTKMRPTYSVEFDDGTFGAIVLDEASAGYGWKVLDDQATLGLRDPPRGGR